MQLGAQKMLENGHGMWLFPCPQGDELEKKPLKSELGTPSQESGDLTLSLVRFEASGRSLNFSKPQLPHLQNIESNLYFI